jgi:hypothetical protein
MRPSLRSKCVTLFALCPQLLPRMPAQYTASAFPAEADDRKTMVRDLGTYQKALDFHGQNSAAVSHAVQELDNI